MPLTGIGGGGSARSELPYASIPKRATALATRASRVEEHLQAQVDAAVVEPPSAAIAVDEAHEVRFATRRSSGIHVEVNGVVLTADVQVQGGMRFSDVPIVAAFSPGPPRTLPFAQVKTSRLFPHTLPNATSMPVSVNMDLIRTCLRGMLQKGLEIKWSTIGSRHASDTSGVRAIMSDILKIAFASMLPVMFLVSGGSACKHVNRHGTKRAPDIIQIPIFDRGCTE